LDIAVTARGLEATVKFATAEENPQADQVYRLIQGGYLRAGSVGFRVNKWEMIEKTDTLRFTEVELLEFSVVCVPSNPDALVSARSAGFDVSVFDVPLVVPPPAVIVPTSPAPCGRARAISQHQHNRNTIILKG
jgi:phage head maturation protease